jgi:hypothetical protein
VLSRLGRVRGSLTKTLGGADGWTKVFFFLGLAPGGRAAARQRTEAWEANNDNFMMQFASLQLYFDGA